jgi:hypothetical protein
MKVLGIVVQKAPFAVESADSGDAGYPGIPRAELSTHMILRNPKDVASLNTN